jgi:hypothetical protein
MADDTADPQLFMTPEVQALAEKRLILSSDIRDVLRHAETTGEKIQNSANGHFITSHQIAAVTYWVEYSSQDAGFVIHNVYSHRMTVGPGRMS